MTSGTHANHLPVIGTHQRGEVELDAASQDVVTEVVCALEQQVWMVRSQFDVTPRPWR